jgi:predicted RNA-binding protein with PIN domain
MHVERLCTILRKWLTIFVTITIHSLNIHPIHFPIPLQSRMFTAGARWYSALATQYLLEKISHMITTTTASGGDKKKRGKAIRKEVEAKLKKFIADKKKN